MSCYMTTFLVQMLVRSFIQKIAAITIVNHLYALPRPSESGDRKDVYDYS